MVQIGLSALTVIILLSVTFILYKRRAGEKPEIENYDRITLDSLLRVVKNEMAEISKDNELYVHGDAMYEAVIRNKRRIAKALTESVYGIPAQRQVVIGLIRNVLERELPTRNSVLSVIDFDNPTFLDPQIKWEILLERLKSKHGRKIIRYLEDKYHISELRNMKNGYNQKLKREFDYQMLDGIFRDECMTDINEDGKYISYEEMLDVISIILFSRYRGFEVLDSLMQLDFDGLNFGSSGSIRYEVDGNFDNQYKTTNSVWVQIDAKWTLFSFIDFKTVNKQKKVINQLVSYGAMAPMTEKSPYKVTDGYDGSRRVAIRPPAGETWFFSCRKFTLGVYKMRTLLDKPYVKNWELPAKLIEYLMKAEETTAFTGQQNTGKTTIMKSAVEHVRDKNIRILEMSFELALREIYQDVNVMTVKPTDYVTSSQLQDLLKKTDGWMSMVGEVAEDIVAARMIQFCLIASAFTIFSHHGLDDWGLINGLTNSLVASGEYHDHSVAMSTVLDVIKNNVHLTFTSNKERVIEYISQIIKLSELSSYPELDDLMKQAKTALSIKDEKQAAKELSQIMLAQTMLTREFYTRTTDRVKFTSRKIIVYNPVTKAYEPNEWYTPDAMERILKKLDSEDRAGFIQFYKENWGCRQH